MRPTPETCARAIRDLRYPAADVVLLAGSVVRGEATATSDLDLVVLFSHVDHAYRESFRHDGWPVEAFVHDLDTLRYFFVELDARGGVASLAAMVSEGIPIPGETDLCRAAQAEARSIIDAGPPPFSADDLREQRYAVTDLADDLRAPRSPAEVRAAGARLHGQLAMLALRARGRWGARGKTIPRALAALDAALAERWERAFEALFARADPAAVLALVDEILAPLGGPLFDGFRRDAPGSWRRG